jgi:hypothetical protein
MAGGITRRLTTVAVEALTSITPMYLPLATELVDTSR